ncbi:galactokinase [Alicyclobacillus sp. SO9]|uniref:galactokinase n=1 Tax=Alicyclobacillus sp. SO9 TaxID=2665646 RepID=UPI0018E80548|nr:galactokinase [Alicyclobacillus sp. SO9]
MHAFFAPGRVNLIGEHTDYNGGYVLPAALNLGTWLFVRKRSDTRLRFGSSSFSKVVDVSVRGITYDPADDYANYPKGVVKEFQKRGFDVPGLDIFYYGNLPNGAGLSSSASVEVATAWMLNHFLNAGLSREDIAVLSQTAENAFVGVQCGIMDQFSVAVGQMGNAVSLHCDTLNYRLVPLQMSGLSIVISNSNKRRGLADSKYNDRRRECEQAFLELQKCQSGIKTLADVQSNRWSQLEGCISDSTIRRRARHVVFENERAKCAPRVLREGDLQRFGQMMNESHISLRDDYEVTGLELDTLAEAAWSVKGCLGSRMTGAGFGGCTVSLVQTDAVELFEEKVRRAYLNRIGYEPSFYVTEAGDGVRDVTEEVAR